MVKGNACTRICEESLSTKGSMKPCRAYNYCVHQGRGLVAGNILGRFLTVMKAIFRKGLAERTALDNACVVVALRGQNAADDPDFKVLLYHIGLMYWNPYRPAFHRLRCTFKEEGLPENDERFYVAATMEFFTAPAAFDACVDKAMWRCKFYIFENCPVPIANVDLEVAPVVPMGNGHPGGFRPPPPKPKRKRKTIVQDTGAATTPRERRISSFTLLRRRLDPCGRHHRRRPADAARRRGHAYDFASRR